mmetsp:Transcript_26500/g.87068  ORF Transcript_26500/g.87068 Transcript_26500/m.87068 type:complete len:318 (-) Transcript_26500:124-1077(-)
MEPSKWLPAGLTLSSRKPSIIAQSSAFKDFRSRFALRCLSVDLNDGEWRFYEGGNRDEPLLLLLPAETGTAESMFRLFLSLSSKGYHVITAQHPPYLSPAEFLSGLDAFLDSVGAKVVHIMGAGLGGLLAQQYSSYRPKRVASLVLCNSFCSLSSSSSSSSSSLAQTAGGMVSPMYQITPTFVLKNIMQSSLRVETIQMSASPEVMEAIEFVVEQLDTFTQADLASRLTLKSTFMERPDVKISHDKITLLDSLDMTTRPDELRDELYKQYDQAKQAFCRVGGDFPYLSVPDEVTLYLEVHLRRMGVFVNKPQLQVNH